MSFPLLQLPASPACSQRCASTAPTRAGSVNVARFTKLGGYVSFSVIYVVTAAKGECPCLGYITILHKLFQAEIGTPKSQDLRQAKGAFRGAGSHVNRRWECARREQQLSPFA